MCVFCVPPLVELVARWPSVSVHCELDHLESSPLSSTVVVVHWAKKDSPRFKLDDDADCCFLLQAESTTILKLTISPTTTTTTRHRHRLLSTEKTTTLSDQLSKLASECNCNFSATAAAAALDSIPQLLNSLTAWQKVVTIINNSCNYHN